MIELSAVDRTTFLVHPFICFIGIFCVIFLAAYSLRQIKKNWLIARWKKSLHLNHHSQVFHQIYADINGFLLSRQARKEKDAIEYVYGEIAFLPFAALLSLVKPDSKTVFYDLGSGVGKAVLTCSMIYPVRQCIGVELFPELYDAANSKKEMLAKMPAYTEKAKKIHFILGDFLKLDLNDATLIFINSTALIGETWENLCAKLNKLEQLQTIITTSKPFVGSAFSLVHSTKIQMSWGVILAFISSRKTNCN